MLGNVYRSWLSRAKASFGVWMNDGPKKYVRLRMCAVKYLAWGYFHAFIVDI